MKLKINWDGLGIATSLACAIHCAVLPLVLTSVPVFGNDIIHNLYFEWAMILLAFAVGSYSLFHGYVKHHRSLLPVMLFTTGFLFLVSKQFLPGVETYLLIPAVLLIISAHYFNYRLCHRTGCVSAHHKH